MSFSEDQLDPVSVREIDCPSKEPFECDLRIFIRTTFGHLEPMRPEEFPGARGFTTTGVEASVDLLVLSRAIQQAELHAAEKNIDQHQRRVRHSFTDVLKEMRRALLNIDAGPKYSEFDLELRGTGPLVSIVARMRGR